MPEKTTMKKARRDLASGKSATTAAGEFVREEMEHIRKGKHGARSSKQAIAIGLSKARRAGVPLKPPAPGRTSAKTRAAATRAYEVGQGKRKPQEPVARPLAATTRGARSARGAGQRHGRRSRDRRSPRRERAAARASPLR